MFSTTSKHAAFKHTTSFQYIIRLVTSNPLSTVQMKETVERASVEERLKRLNLTVKRWKECRLKCG